jgi:predicted transcriptional regulator
MAEYGEWNRKGATLSDVTARKEYGVSRNFIVKGIRAGKLEYREGAIWGNPYLRVLRSQLEQYIAETFGSDRVSSGKNQTELRKIKKEMADLQKRLAELQARRTELEKALKTSPTEHQLAADGARCDLEAPRLKLER